MPTGYTSPIHDGKPCTFRQFALRCARNFRALVLMRDQSLDAQIPDRFEPSTYHTDKLIETKQLLAEVEALTDEECAARADAEANQENRRREEMYRDSDALSGRYQDMRQQVQAWEEPTEEHRNLKRFMLEQLAESQLFDCHNREDYEEFFGEVEIPNGAEWRAKTLANIHKDIAYHTEQYQAEVQRVAGRNLWIQQLRNSLPEE